MTPRRLRIWPPRLTCHALAGERGGAAADQELVPSYHQTASNGQTSGRLRIEPAGPDTPHGVSVDDVARLIAESIDADGDGAVTEAEFADALWCVHT